MKRHQTRKRYSMSFFSEASESLFKYTEKIVTKTEEYARIGKITLDIKRLERTIEKAHHDIGEFVVSRVKHGDASIACGENAITEKVALIDDCRASIQTKRSEIEEIKRSGLPSRRPAGAASAPRTPDDSL